MRATRKPERVQVWQWQGTTKGAPGWVEDAWVQELNLIVPTVSRDVVARLGDWVVRDSTGFLTVSQDDFPLFYELDNDDDNEGEGVL